MRPGVNPPPVWTTEQFTQDAATAIAEFREKRLQEPLEQYLEAFELHRDGVENLIESTVDLKHLSDQAVELLTDPELLVAVRYLASPVISEDDLKVLAEAQLTPSRIRADETMARRIISIVLLGLDRNRFPWVSEIREPTEAERYAAIISTAALMATQSVQTSRRTTSKNEQEDAVAAILTEFGFTEVARRVITNTSHLPDPGEFCRESSFVGRKADLVVRLWDGRTMPIECKVSNSSTNSVKRLNNDAAVKAVTWIQEFGRVNVVPAAVLTGVFKVHNLESAQRDGLTIFWAHNLSAMMTFIDSTQH